MKLLKVTWQDAISEDDWIDIEKAKTYEPHTITTIGYLVNETQSKIILAGSWDPEREAVCQFMTIPAPWVINREEVEE